MNTARGTDDDLGTVLEGLHVVANAGATNAGVALNVHEVADGNDDLLDLLSKLTGGGEDEGLALLDVGVDLLEDGDGEGGSLASTGLSLGNDIVTWAWSEQSLRRTSRRSDIPLMTGMMARCWMAEGRSKP